VKGNKWKRLHEEKVLEHGIPFFVSCSDSPVLSLLRPTPCPHHHLIVKISFHSPSLLILLPGVLQLVRNIPFSVPVWIIRLWPGLTPISMANVCLHAVSETERAKSLPPSLRLLLLLANLAVPLIPGSP
jgi:hypothetical protein